MNDIGTLEHKIRVLEDSRISNKNSRINDKNIVEIELENERLIKSNMIYQNDINDLETSVKKYKIQINNLTDDNERLMRLYKKI